MSYILEALKRAEQERQIGQIPNAAAPAPEAYDSERRYWPWVLLAVLLLAVAVLVLTFRLSADRSVIPEQAVTQPQSQTQPVTEVTPNRVQADKQASDLPTRVTAVRPEPTVVIQAAPIELTPIAEVRLPAEPDAVEPAQAEPQKLESQASATTSAADTPPVSAERQPAPAPKAEPEASETASAVAQSPFEEAAESQAEAPAVAPVASLSTVESGADEPASAGADSEPADYELPWLNEMPLAFRRGMPSLEIQFHRYTDDRSRSFVMIGGQRYREGQILKSGPTLERIVEEGLILRWRGERFIYPLGG